ncbi:uncharacterized protein LOC117883078 [Trachemys scripta elegans]|uniref:uncharacterized protein LOC117883078 n=1 Tax=Trachemys scripta elegans TaxID=31138 RepID=UPI001551746F|nr:uncharacterized protein LOC117883078 [Trachemys scripta elegans]
MDEDFRQCLCEYVTSVVHSAGTHVRTDRAGQVLTGAQLAARIKGVSRYWKTQRYDFSSPMKMAEAFAVMRQELNRRAVEATRREYDQFVQELDRDHQSMSSCLWVKPLEMQRCLEGKCQELLERCRGELRGKDPQKQAALEELKKELDKQMAEFLPRYEQRFKVKKAEWLGLYFGRGGGGGLAVVGAGIGVGIRAGAALVGLEEAVAIGIGTGVFGLIAGVGHWLRAWFGQKMAQNKTGTNTPSQGNERERRAGCSD